MDIRNVAIIAHVDHGKTTLMDHLLKQGGAFSSHGDVDDRFMDSGDLERERGITITAKNASINYEGVRINFVDTPGHGDFGGEVERILNMVDGTILLVDASEGPLPQTRFVLSKALEQNKRVFVCVNKIDRKDARVDEVMNEIFDLFVDLGATDEQADFTTIFAIAKDGKAATSPEAVEGAEDLKCIFDLILEKFPQPKADPEAPLQMLVANIDYDSYVGRLAVGRVYNGTLKIGQPVKALQEDGKVTNFKTTALYRFKSSSYEKVDEIVAGDIAIAAGLEEIAIGDTITNPDHDVALTRLVVDEPTVGIFLGVNDSPYAGLEGKEVTSRKILERLERELRTNVSIQVESTDNPDTFKILGRGELQLSVLCESMRREGFEFQISQPRVVYRDIEGVKCEPILLVQVDVDQDYMGAVTQKLQERKGLLVTMDNPGTGRVRAEFQIPARGLIGYRSEFLTDTRGTGLLNSQYQGYEPFKGEIKQRNAGRMVSDRQGKSTTYALNNLEDRGSLFIEPGTPVYKGMIIGDYNKGTELNVNVTKEKKLTNVRASGTDEGVQLTRVKPMTLEQALEWIKDDEWIEVTPQSLRLRLRD